VFVSYTHFEVWWGVTPFEKNITQIRNADDTLAIECELRYREPDKITVSVPAINSILNIAHAFRSAHGDFHQVHWEHSLSIGLQLHSAQCLYWYLERIRDVRYLLTLLIGEPILPIMIAATIDTVREDKKLQRVFILHPGYSTRNDEKISHPLDMIVPAVELAKLNEDSLPRIFQLWFEKSTYLERSSRIYFSVEETKGIFLELKLLALTQALESYHKKRFNNSRIILRERLGELRQSMSPLFQDMIHHNIDQFIDNVVKNRNFYTHYGDEESAKVNVLSGEALYQLTLRLSLFITILMLRELELPDEFILERLRASHKFGYLIAREQDNS